MQSAERHQEDGVVTDLLSEQRVVSPSVRTMISRIKHLPYGNFSPDQEEADNRDTAAS